MKSLLSFQRSLFSGTPPVLPPPTLGNKLSTFLNFWDSTSLSLDGSNNIIAATDQSTYARAYTDNGNAGNRPFYDSSLFGGKGAMVSNNSNSKGLIGVFTMSEVLSNNLTMILVGRRRSNKAAGAVYDYVNNINWMQSGFNSRYGNSEGLQTRFGIPLNELTLIGLANTGDGNSYFFDESGNKMPLYPAGVLGNSGSAIGNLIIGSGSGFGPGMGADFDYVSYILYSKAFSDSDLATFLNWARPNYGLPNRGTVPLSPNYRIIFEGDSITVGNFSDGESFEAAAIDGLGLSPTDYLTCGTNGAQLADLSARISTNITPFLSAGKKNVVSILIGTNDLVQSGFSQSAWKSAFVAYIQAIKALSPSPKVIVTTIFDRKILGGQNASFASDRAAINSWILANQSAIGWDYVADWGNNSSMGVTGDNANTTYFNSDGVHPTTAGHAIGGSYIQTQLAAALV